MRSSPEGGAFIRVVETDLAQPAYTVACDEALLVARAEGSIPDTLHIYRRSRPTISLGYFQSLEDCIDVELAGELGIEVIRRVSGGSAIYTDPGQLIYCLAISADEIPESPRESYPLLCRGVVEALAILGLQAEYRPLNDVEVGGRKISGSAQTRKRGVVLQHGTLLVDTDIDLMVRLLKAQRDKRWRARSEITTLKEELGTVPKMKEVRSAMIEGFSISLGRRMAHAPFSRMEHELIEGILKKKA
jgi:lipoate-protein ligase A